MSTDHRTVTDDLAMGRVFDLLLWAGEIATIELAIARDRLIKAVAE